MNNTYERGPVRQQTVRSRPAGRLLAVIVGLGRARGLADRPGVRVATWAVLSARPTPARADRFGPANRVTLARAALVGGVTALVADPSAEPAAADGAGALTAVALILDAVDGKVARRTGTLRALGARFDMEVDAFLILVLSVYVSHRRGPVGAADRRHALRLRRGGPRSCRG